jgi:hypothetical protein
VSPGDALVFGLQGLGLLVGVALMALAVRVESPNPCPREKLGYICRRGSGIKCQCEKSEDRLSGD